MTPHPDRAAWLGLLATAPHDRLLALWAAAGPAPDHQLLRAPVGHGHVQGRSHAAARAAAVIDALMQTDQAADLTTKILTPLATEQASRRTARAARAAATKVDFFTLMRGDD